MSASDPRSPLGIALDGYAELKKRVDELAKRVEQLEADNAPKLAVGTILYGYCNGFFGRDSYETKRVEAFGYDWILARDKDGHRHYCSFSAEWLPQKDKMIREWMKRPADDEYQKWEEVGA